MLVCFNECRLFISFMKGVVLLSKQYGRIIKTFRLNKQLTLKEVSKEVLSESQLSKFERGETEISFDKMIGILSNLNMTAEELFLHSPEYLDNNFENILRKIRLFYSENNIAKLKSLYKNELFKYQESKLIFHKLNSICIKGFLLNLNVVDYNISSAENNFLTNYLFSVEVWSKYEVLLFSNSISFLSTESIIILTKEMTKSKVFHKNHDSYNRILIQVLINASIVLMEKDYLKEVNFLLKMIDDIITDETFLYEKNVLLFLRGMYQFNTGNTDAAIIKMKQAIEIFEKLDSISIAENYNNYFKNLIKK